MAKFYEFYPEIYPTRLWLAKSSDITLEDLLEKFYFLSKNDEIIEEGFELPPPNVYATTISVREKRSGWRGCLVLLNRKDIRPAILAHEALHCTDWLFELLDMGGFGFGTDEPRAYYLQWCVDKMCEVLKKK